MSKTSKPKPKSQPITRDLPDDLRHLPQLAVFVRAAQLFRAEASLLNVADAFIAAGDYRNYATVIENVEILLSNAQVHIVKKLITRAGQK